MRVISVGYNGVDGTFVFSKGDPSHNTIQFAVKPIDILTINLTAVTPFISGGLITEMGLTAKVAADFGTLGFMFLGESTADFFDGLGFGLGYSNSFDAVDFFVDAAALFMPYLPVFAMGLSVDAQAIFKLDDIKISVYGIYQNTIAEGSDYAGDLWAILRFDYSLDSAGLYIKLMDNNILQNGDILIKPGVTFNIGAASCDASVELTIPTASGKNVGISVPVEITVGL